MISSIFISHGAPTILTEGGPAADFLKGLGRTLGKPRAILSVSAHWETAVPTVGARTSGKIIYDFWGFPDVLYMKTYPSPPAVEAAAEVVAALRTAGIPHAVDNARGLDHGTWVPLSMMYPEADVPVAHLSVQPMAGPAAQIALGRALAPLREADILIMGSGAATHNLGFWQPGSAVVPAWAQTFDDWLTDVVERGDADELARYRDTPEGALAHPRDEHLLPLMVAMGAGGFGRVLHRGFEDGALSMAAYAFD